MMFALPDLAYGYSDLEPVISETTLRTHYGKHHARYVQVTNELVAEAGGTPASLEQVIAEAQRGAKRKLFNNAAQAWNHGFFWVSMTPGGSMPAGELETAITADFGDLQGLREAFAAEGVSHFGSGWVWLIAKQDGLAVLSTHDAATPLTEEGVTPLLVCDVWEHAYYLDHKNDRATFLSAWWDRLINWDLAASQYAAAKGERSVWTYPSPTAAV
jgi:Fe-Mn family superoxide dismutase